MEFIKSNKKFFRYKLLSAGGRADKDYADDASR